MNLKESVTLIQNYVEIHMAEEAARVYDYGHELHLNQE